MIIVGDTFVEASNTALGSHTPTGPYAGSGWTVAVGAMTIDAATDVLWDNNGGAGNRAAINNNLGSDVMIVQGDISFFNAAAGLFLASGVRGRVASVSSIPDGYSFLYDWGISGTGGWSLSDGTTSTDVVEAYPGGTVAIRMEILPGNVRGYVNGVLKCTLATNSSTGNTFAGVALLNFSGAAGRTRIDNFLAYTPRPPVWQERGMSSAVHRAAYW